jgi:serine phosphatase RsbU (regulator of sigma subunit)
MAYLQLLTGDHAGQRYQLTSVTSSIGRHPECEIALVEAQRVSRYHAQVVRQGDQYFVKDLGSRNGTFVNDQKISDQPYSLKDGDCVSICDLRFQFFTQASELKAVSSSPTQDNIPAVLGEGSSMAAAMVDDDESSSSNATIMSKVEVGTGSEGSVQVSASLPARLAALLEITRSLGNALALDQVLPQVLRTMFRIFLQADRGLIVLETPSGDLVPRWAQSRREDGGDTIRISRTIVRHVMNTKEAILSADALRDERLDMSQSIAELRIRSVMCAPLLDSEGKAMGVIEVDTMDQRKRFQQGDLEVLACVATQAGIAIHNAELHDNALKQKEIEQDLALAHEVQKSFLPQQCPQHHGYEFYEYYRPANHVGGDYYDYISLPDGRTAVIVADVVGHGVAAAMLMAKLSAEAKYCLASEHDPSQALCKLNDRLSNMQTDRFVTLIMVVLDPATHQVTLLNAGHMAPLWRKGDGTLAEPGGDAAGLPVGIMEGFLYESKTITLGPGELLLMYTDGVNEAMNGTGQQFTIDRMRQHVIGGPGSVRGIGEAIIADVRSFIGSGPQTDDMCLVGFARS